MADHMEQAVRGFVSEHVGVDLASIRDSTTLFGDLGVDGDDGCEVLSGFAREFFVDMTTFELDRHFGLEGLPPWFLFDWLLLLFRHGAPEERSRLEPISVSDLVLRHTFAL